ncbi:MAG: substrate-binding periplasmic protein [Telluria sp.]
MRKVLGILGMLAALALGMACQAQTILTVTESSNRTALVGGKVRGPFTTIAEASLTAAGLKDFKTALYPWARAYHLALTQPYVLIYPMARTPERENKFKWVGEMQTIHYGLVKLASRKDIVIRDIEDARGYSVGVVRDDVRHEYLKQHGFNRLFLAANWNDNLVHLLKGQIDMLILADFDLTDTCAELNVSCSVFQRAYEINELTTGLYMAYSLATPDPVVERTRIAFTRLKADGTVDRVIRTTR